VMSKTEVEELILTPPPPAVKPNRHLVIAKNHLTKRMIQLTGQADKLNREIEEVEAALKALG
jgi:hypothetical protein